MSVALEILDLLMNCGCMQYARNFSGLTLDKLYSYTWEDLKRVLPNDLENAEELARNIQKQILLCRSKLTHSSVDDDVTIVEVVTKSCHNQDNVKTEVIEYDSDSGNDDMSDVSDESINSDSENGTEETVVLSSSGFSKCSVKRETQVQVRISNVTKQNPAGAHVCQLDDLSSKKWTQWTTSLTYWASLIKSLEVNIWTWSNLNSTCPFNLFKILSNKYINITQLLINCDITTSCDQQREPFSAKFGNHTLPQLKIIKICHDGPLSYRKQLNEILHLANNIEILCFTNEDPAAVTTYLHVLEDFSTSHPLNTLKTISLKSLSGSGYLTQEHLLKLSNIKAAELKELDVGMNLYEDIKEDLFSKMLRQFPKMQRLKIQGCFQGHSNPMPNMQMTFPRMSHLRFVDIGSDYEFTYHVDNAKNVPSSTKKRKTNDCSQESNGDSKMGQLKPFAVNIKLSSLPRLTVLRLGNLFNLDTFSLSNMPRLIEFRVGSRWDLSINFSRKRGDSLKYPTLKSLQLPDNLQDPTIVQQLPVRFPNLQTVWIFLPTVQVLRKFSKIMESSVLENLHLQTQFDFDSTLDSCLVDCPSEIEVTRIEQENVKHLKEYQHWQEFVNFHNIQMPPDDFKSLEREDWAGLGSLKNLMLLDIEHIPRTLKIPRGPLKWNAPHCYFTDHSIGFDRYPWPEIHTDLKSYFVNCHKLSLRMVGFDGPDKYLQGTSYMRKHSIKMNPTEMSVVPKQEAQIQN